MTFTYDWTTDRVDKWLPYVQHLVGRANVNALEIGAFEGRSTVWMLENILTDPTSRIVCLDPFLGGSVPDLPNEYLTAFVENTKPYQRQIRIIQARSEEVTTDILAHFSPGGYDLIYIDASHLPEATVREAFLAWNVASDGALIIFDDYAGSLREAVDEWRKAFVGRIEVWDTDAQLILRKIR